MKTKLLRRLRRIGRSQIDIIGVTTTNGTVTGMRIVLNSEEYRGLFDFGNERIDVYRKAERIYITININYIRKRYKKYSVNYKNLK